MTIDLHVGYVPLVDAAPLFVAQTLGFAQEEDLRLILHAAPSWASLRDMLAQGQVDAAHMLTPMPVAMALGLIRGEARFDILSVLNLNGNVIGVSKAIADRMRQTGHGFDFVDARRAGQGLLGATNILRIGVPHVFSMHNELIQYWLGALGADQAKLEIRTVPPPLMADAIAAGEIDAFCVGEPWGSVAVDDGVAELLLPGAAIWASAPEKGLAVRMGWADDHPVVAGQLMRAVWRAGRWLGAAENRMIASELLAAPDRLAISAELIERVLSGRLTISATGEERHTPRLIEFHNSAATFPWRSQAAWIGAALARRFRLDPVAAAQTAVSVFRTDFYRTHLRGAGAVLPCASEKLEGAVFKLTGVASENGELILPVDRFFDARIFDPALPRC